MPSISVNSPLTFYVNNVAGSDSNAGTTPERAFATIQAAVNGAASCAATRTIQVATTGVIYGEAISLPERIIGPGYITVQGDQSNNLAVLVGGNSSPAFTAVNSNGFILDSLGVTSTGDYAVISDAQSHLLAHNMNYGGATTANVFVEHGAFYEDLRGSCVVSVGAHWHIAVAARGHYVSQGHFISFVGNPKFASSFALGGTGGFLDGRLITFSGAYVSGLPNAISNDGTALMLPNPNGGWP